MASYQVLLPVRQSQCGRNGLLHMSRYFELTNRVVEDWFADALGTSFADIHLQQRRGVPTVQLDFHLHTPLRAGEQAVLRLTVSSVSQRALKLRIEGRCGTEPRFTTDAVLVFADLEGERPRSTEIPPSLRTVVSAYLEPAARQRAG